MVQDHEMPLEAPYIFTDGIEAIDSLIVQVLTYVKKYQDRLT